METEIILRLWVLSCWSAIALVLAWMIWKVNMTLKDEEIARAVVTVRESAEGYRQFERFIRGVNGEAVTGEDIPASELIAMLAKKLGVSERNLLYQLGQIPDGRKVAR